MATAAFSRTFHHDGKISPEAKFVNVSGAQESIPPAYVACRVGTSNRVVVPARQAGNRFLNSLKGLQIQAQAGEGGGRGARPPPLTVYEPSRTKLQCTLQLREQILLTYFISTPYALFGIYCSFDTGKGRRVEP